MTRRKDYTIAHWRRIARELWIGRGPTGLQFYDENDAEQQRCISLIARNLAAAYEAGRKGTPP